MPHDDTNYFFKQHHYDAFHPSRHEDESQEAVLARVAVRDKLIELENRLSPKLAADGLDLHPHYDLAYLTSRVEHKAEGSLFNSPKIQEIWLHYGRSKAQTEQLKRDRHDPSLSPVYQMRIQVTVQEDGIGIWLRVGMPGGGLWEKERLQQAGRQNTELLDKLWDHVQRLEDYHLYVDDNNVFWFRKMHTSNDLKEALRSVRPNKYALISRNIEADDSSLTHERIADTVATEFNKLYPIYELLVG